MDALPPRFAIGGHPMCGEETVAGLLATISTAIKPFFFALATNGWPPSKLWPCHSSTRLARIRCGSLPPTTTRPLAAVSHLPALLSAALMRVAADERCGRWAPRLPRHFRLAGSDARMLMLDILLTNRKVVLRSVARL